MERRGRLENGVEVRIVELHPSDGSDPSSARFAIMNGEALVRHPDDVDDTLFVSLVTRKIVRLLPARDGRDGSRRRRSRFTYRLNTTATDVARPPVWSPRSSGNAFATRILLHQRMMEQRTLMAKQAARLLENRADLARLLATTRKLIRAMGGSGA